jgi:DNA mismatch repair ATPase MutS
MRFHLDASGWRRCAFQEEPEVEGFFDYKLRSGAATERNAIRLLQRIGFPADVVAKAMTYAAPKLDSADAGVFLTRALLPEE